MALQLASSLLKVFLVGQYVIQRDPEINWVTVVSDMLAIEEHRQFTICSGDVKMEHTTDCVGGTRFETPLVAVVSHL